MVATWLECGTIQFMKLIKIFCPTGSCRIQQWRNFSEIGSECKTFGIIIKKKRSRKSEITFHILKQVVVCMCVEWGRLLLFRFIMNFWN